MLYGVGYNSKIKNFKTCENGKKTREYRLWQRMLERCYSEKLHKIKPSYIGCSVDKRWHDFQNFCEDIKTIKGYDLWINQENKMQLDKDSILYGNKIYSKDLCVFLTSQENNLAIIKNSKGSKIFTGKIYIAHRILDNYEEEFFNIREFSRNNGLSHGNVRKCLNRQANQTKGWSFRVK